MSSLGNKEIFARNLKYYIERCGKDRRELAEIWGFPYSTLSEWLNARKYPRIDRIEIMADYFGIQKSDLIEEQVPEQEKPAIADGLSDSQRKLIEFAKTVPEDKAALILRVMQSIVEADE